MEDLRTITREELKKWIDEKKDFILIDVLPPNSYEGRHLPGAKNAPVSESDFLEKVEKFASNKEHIIVAYCSSFQCQASPRAANMLVKAGYTNVYHFKGGLADWQDAKYSFEGEVAEEKVEHEKNCC